MPAFEAAEPSHPRHFDITTFDSYRHAFDQRLCDFLPGRRDDPPECLAGYFHLLGGMFLIQTLEISEPDCFQFVDLKHQFLQARHRYPGWLE